jgi:serpin B
MSVLSRRKFFALSGAAAAGAALGRYTQACPVLSAAEGEGNALATGNAAFGTDLYARLRAEKGDLFLSPFSVSTALAMTAAGARGKTFDEMAKVLRLPESKDPHAAFGPLLAEINRNAAVEKPAYQLSTANAIWAQEGYPWRKEFVELTQKNYGAGLIPTDFSMPEEARQRINGWVEKETRDRIKDLIPRGELDRLTVMVLTNAIYFKSAWMNPFARAATADQPFFKADGTKAPVKLMTVQEHAPYHETDEVQVVELPYEKRELSMVVVLPRKADGLAKVEAALTAETLAAWAAAAKPANTRVYLPRFKIEWERELKSDLMDMGMKLAFTAGADFGGMHTGSEKIMISKVIHKAFVDVDEVGTEAAAATAVIMKRASAVFGEPKVFRADRPFLFAIRENKTGSLLFLGRYTGPKG